MGAAAADAVLPPGGTATTAVTAAVPPRCVGLIVSPRDFSDGQGQQLVLRQLGQGAHALVAGRAHRFFCVLLPAGDKQANTGGRSDRERGGLQGTFRYVSKKKWKRWWVAVMVEGGRGRGRGAPLFVSWLGANTKGSVISPFGCCSQNH